ncbi:MAG: hypothetical protein ACRCX2_36090 [Paraclostridium sp.]
MANFAIKDAMDLKITKIGQSTPLMTVDFLNSCSFERNTENVFAKKKGINAIAFAGTTEGTFSMNSEMTNTDLLAMQLGAVKTGEAMKATAVLPADAYKIEGTFRVVEEGGVEKIYNMVFPNCKPQPSGSIEFSAENVASFDMSWDIMVDQDGTFFEMKPATQSLSK